jgi:hypothetical protein
MQAFQSEFKLCVETKKKFKSKYEFVNSPGIIIIIIESEYGFMNLYYYYYYYNWIERNLM